MTNSVLNQVNIDLEQSEQIIATEQNFTAIVTWYIGQLHQENMSV